MDGLKAIGACDAAGKRVLGFGFLFRFEKTEPVSEVRLGEVDIAGDLPAGQKLPIGIGRLRVRASRLKIKRPALREGCLVFHGRDLYRVLDLGDGFVGLIGIEERAGVKPAETCRIFVRDKPKLLALREELRREPVILHALVEQAEIHQGCGSNTRVIATEIAGQHQIPMGVLEKGGIEIVTIARAKQLIEIAITQEQIPHRRVAVLLHGHLDSQSPRPGLSYHPDSRNGCR